MNNTNDVVLDSKPTNDRPATPPYQPQRSRIKNRLTHHAKQRLKERSSLSKEEFLDLLDGPSCIAVGRSLPQNRLYKLFYSQKDRKHFVVILSLFDGGIITILPLGYFYNLAWKIPKIRLKEAVYRASPEHFNAIYPTTQSQRNKYERRWKRPPTPPPNHYYKIKLYAHRFVTDEPWISLGYYQFDRTPVTPEEAMENSGFVKVLREQVRKYQIPIGAIDEVAISDPTFDYRIIIPWEVLDDYLEDH